VIIDRSGGPGAGFIAVIVLAVVVVIGFLWFFTGNRNAGGNIEVDVPAVSVSVQPGG
jgi:hypothetical protein